jgi:hypothetical protein
MVLDPTTRKNNQNRTRSKSMYLLIEHIEVKCQSFQEPGYYNEQPCWVEMNCLAESDFEIQVYQLEL